MEGTADYVHIQEGGTCVDIDCGSGALSIAVAKRNPKAKVLGCDRWGKEYEKNPHCEIGGMVNKGQWIRVTGEAVFDQDDSYAEKYLNEVSPGLKHLYNDQTGHRLASFYLEDMQTTLYAMGRILETIEDDQK